MAVPGRMGPWGRLPGPGGERVPAWYPDPERSTLLRYWDGSRWTPQRRPRPAWTAQETAVVVAGAEPQLDGPVRPGGPPFPVASTAAPSRETPARGDSGGSAGPTSDGPLRGAQLRPGGGNSNGGGGGTGGGGGGGGGGHDGTPAGAGGDRPPTRSRRKWILMASVAVLAAVGVGLAGEAMRPKPAGHRVLTDNTYIRLANAACNRTMPGLRPPDSGPFGQVQTPAQTADQIQKAATGLDTLTATLRSLPVAGADRVPVNTWLDGWSRYISLGRRYSDFLRQQGNANPGSLITDSVAQAKASDKFALANGLGGCSLFATPQPDPSNEF